MTELDDVVKEFLVESHENLSALEQDLVRLEQTPDDSKEALARIFRTVHTVKGTCGFLGFSKLESVTHVGENLLSKLRDGVLHVTGDITSALLALVDAIREMLTSVETTGEEGPGDYSALIAELTRLLEPKQAPPKPQLRAADASVEVERAEAPVAPIGELLVQAGRVTREEVKEVLELQQAGDPRHVGEILVEQGRIVPEDVVDALNVQKKAKPQTGGLADTTIRVEVSQLDKLMNLVGELVLARNQILQFIGPDTDAVLQTTTQRLNLVTTELQEGVMKTRMQPIDTVWSKFPRVIRDLARSCRKRVRVEMEGRDTELDKTIIEAIKDPLTHIVRNAVDHGVESPEEREAAGKPPEGFLRLQAFHEGGHVNIEISDDGGGIDPEKLKRKAQEKGLVSAAALARMSERELLSLIFMPGFSTAKEVTNVSGRGVGMDVVKTNIERIGGTVDISSRIGAGTTIHIKIPLTLAIIPALVVASGHERFAIPQVSLLELVRMDLEKPNGGIEDVSGVPVYRLRGNLLPIVDLGFELFGKKSNIGENGVATIVVLQADERQFGLLVEEIHDTEEIVVKPLGKQLKNLSAFSGATIMGDGRVALILDVLGLAQMARVVGTTRDRSLGDRGKHAQESAEKPESLLLVRVGTRQTLAIPLRLVARLEEVALDSVERAGASNVVQYRGQIMPLIHLSEVVSEIVEADLVAPEVLSVVVFDHLGQSVGLVVSAIVDIVDEAVKRHSTAKRPGILGSGVVQGQVVELVDLPGLMQRVLPRAVSDAPAALVA
ncbi:MAG: chemotaxis protein CheW [Polyangiaceae bacterium]|nr:chemotaxis protein CheW [Polyangiaceae bacterium]